MATRAEKREAQSILKATGFPIKVDGDWGPWSKRALIDATRAFAWERKQVRGFKRPKLGGRLTKKRLRMLRIIERKGYHCSKHYKYTDFRCKGYTRGLTGPADNWIKVSRGYVRKMEKYAHNFGKPYVVSACRSSTYNRLVGGSSTSSHRYSFIGNRFGMVCKAADISPTRYYGTVRNVWGRGGIGYNRSTAYASHVDNGPRTYTWSYPR